MKRAGFSILAATVAATLAISAQSSPSGPNPASQQRPDAPPLGANEWRIDGSHSAANFSVRHMMVSTVRGQLGRITGTLEYDGRDVRSIKADVTIDVTAINTQNDRRDNDLRSDGFFDVDNHPHITFKSKRAEPAAEGRFKLIGDLTIRGTTKEVVLDVEGPSPIVKAQQGVATGATATAKINRREFGLNYNRMVEAGPVVSDDVAITIDIQARRPATPGSTQ